MDAIYWSMFSLVGLIVALFFGFIVSWLISPLGFIFGLLLGLLFHPNLRGKNDYR